MRSVMKAFWRETSGAVSIEYAMIAGFVAMGIITLLMNIGGQTSSPFYGVEAGLKLRPM